MNPLALHLIIGWGISAVLMLGFYLRQRTTKNATAVDLGWALSIGLAAALYAVIGDGDEYRRLLTATMACAWSLRLSFHLFADRVMKRKEDARYAALRQLWGDRAQFNFFWFYMGQSALAALLSVPFALQCEDTIEDITLAEVVGSVLWLTGLIGEAVADRQLARFRADPANRGLTCRAGLWNWSRHPNYFFEWVIWLGFGIMPLQTPLGYIALVAPALMWFLIVKVTGIPPAELQALKSRGENYKRYQREVNAFVPWPPKTRH